MQQLSTAQQIAILEFHDEALTMCGVDLYMRSRSGTVDVNVRVYDADRNTKPGKLLGSGKVKIGTTLQSYSVTFSPKPRIPKNAIYFIVFDNADKLMLPVSPTGSTGIHLEMRNNTWGNIYHSQTRWQFRVHCDRGSRTPLLDASTRPLIGQTMRFDLSNAKGATPGLMLLGGSDKNWGALRLPFTYAGNCSLLVSGDIVLPIVTNASGTAAVAFPIPPDRRLVGLLTYAQCLVVDKANAAGLISSNGGRAKVGEF